MRRPFEFAALLLVLLLNACSILPSGDDRAAQMPKPLGSVSKLRPCTAPIPSPWPGKAKAREWPFFGRNAARQQRSPLEFTSSNLEKLWSYDLGEHTYEYRSGTNLWSESPIAIEHEKRIMLIAGAYDHKVHCLDGLSGERLWRFTTGDEIVASPAAQGNLLVVPSTDRSIYGLDMEGSRRWVKETLQWRQTVSPASMSSPLILKWQDRDYLAMGYYINDFGRSTRIQEGRACMLSLDSGEELWSKFLRQDLVFGPAAALCQGRPLLFYATGDGVVCCLDARNGDQIGRAHV